jgi:hypothetical protein
MVLPQSLQKISGIGPLKYAITSFDVISNSSFVKFLLLNVRLSLTSAVKIVSLSNSRISWRYITYVFKLGR